MKNDPRVKGEQGTRRLVTRLIELHGLTPIMFDRYAGDNDTQLEPWQKLYFDPEDEKRLVLPAANLVSFLSAQNTDSAPKKVLDPRKYKKFCQACASFVTIDPDHIPILRDGKPIQFGSFGSDGRDASTGIYIHRGVARLPKGIPNVKVRPVLPLPWSLSFMLRIYPNQDIQEQQLLNVIQRGGVAVGLGTNRPQFGKFEVSVWEEVQS